MQTEALNIYDSVNIIDQPIDFKCPTKNSFICDWSADAWDPVEKDRIFNFQCLTLRNTGCST